VSWAAHLDPQLRLFVRGLTTWLEQHPEISVSVAENLLFYRFAMILLPASLVAVALTIPQLISRDLASNAIVIYASKAVNWLDYLLGKAGIVFGLLTLTWLGPLLAAWFAGNLLAPNWSFFWHARGALGNTLLYVLGAMVFLTLLGLGMSALGRSEKATVGLYVAVWLMGWALEPLGELGQPWLKQLSFHYDLQQTGRAVFRPEHHLATARENVPVLGDLLSGRARRRGEPSEPRPDPAPPWVALGGFALAALGVVLVRTKPQ
jgi:hypothetical protein